MTIYFGSLPAQEWLLLRTPRVTQQETYSFIEGLLSAKADLQAANLISHRSKISVAGCQALLARLNLQQGSFQKALDLSSSAINDYNSSLGSGNTVFTNTTSPEVIWASSNQLNSPEVGFTFNKGTILPEIRLAEMLLINAEGAVELGQLSSVVRDRINPLRARAGLAAITATDQPTLRTAVQEEWKREMAREGMRFSSLARWHKTMPELGPLGFAQKNRYLPIPQGVLDWNFNLQQNPGY
ncbi:RagB/SusD family nutrient uptake outer membrane protein [Paraflavitalea soli]|uniref:RagB/SusD family nutrient uptake outer membrane protein n=1 Tax=Paraflavitalea soli TaxID=2315862 RepID=A0A3B7MRC5_9BACT|nr:RagB/SusD family nutrient uptake outer membrane protein [Paraflavitalea soli]